MKLFLRIFIPLLLWTSNGFSNTYEKELAPNLVYYRNLPDSAAYEAYYYFINEYNGKHPIKNKAVAYFELGRLHNKNYNYGEAIENALYAQNLFFKINHYRGLSDNFIFLGNCFLELEKFNTANKYYLNSLAISNYLGDSASIAISYNNLAGVHYQLKNYELSESYYENSISILKLIKDEEGLARTKLNYSALSMEYNPEKALGLLEDAQTYFSTHSSPEVECFISGNIGAVYYRQGKVNAGIEKYLESLAISEAYDLKQASLVNYKDLSEIYQSIQDYNNAFMYYLKYDSLKNEFAGKQEYELASQLEFNHYINLKDEKARTLTLQVEKAQSEKRELRYLFWLVVAGLILASIIAAGAIMFYRSRILRAQQNKELLMVKNRLITNNLKESEITNKQLQHELDMNKEDLINFSIDIQRKNDIQHKLHTGIKRLRKKAGGHPEMMSELIELVQLSATNMKLNANTENIAENIEKVNHEFFAALSERFPNLTTNEKKLCGLIRIKTSIREIASIRGISPKSVEMSRYRLKKKLGLGEELNLDSFIESL